MPPGDDSFKDINVVSIQIPEIALETLAHLGVEQFPLVTDWSQRASQLSLRPGSEPDLVSEKPTRAFSQGESGVGDGVEDEASSERTPDVDPGNSPGNV